VILFYSVWAGVAVIYGLALRRLWTKADLGLIAIAAILWVVFLPIHLLVGLVPPEDE
jgi:hypothetical protein